MVEISDLQNLDVPIEYIPDLTIKVSDVLNDICSRFNEVMISSILLVFVSYFIYNYVIPFIKKRFDDKMDNHIFSIGGYDIKLSRIFESIDNLFETFIECSLLYMFGLFLYNYGFDGIMVLSIKIKVMIILSLLLILWMIINPIIRWLKKR